MVRQVTDRLHGRILELRRIEHLISSALDQGLEGFTEAECTELQTYIDNFDAPRIKVLLSKLRVARLPNASLSIRELRKKARSMHLLGYHKYDRVALIGKLNETNR